MLKLKRISIDSCKANFTLKGAMDLIDVKFNITYQNKQRIFNSSSSSSSELCEFFDLIGLSDIMLVFTNTINHLYFYQDEHTQ